MQKLNIILYCIMILLSAPSFGQDNDFTDSLAISKLKLGYAYKNGIDKDMDYLFGVKSIERELFEEFELDYPINREVIDSIRTRRYFVEILHRPLYQRMDREGELQEIALVDSLYEEFYKSGDLAQFHQYVVQYSSDPEKKWVTKFYETEEFYDVLKNLSVGSVSQPFVTAKGVYVIYKIDERESLISHRAPFSPKDINGLFSRYHIIQKRDFHKNDNLLDSVIYETPFKDYTIAEFNEFANTSTYGVNKSWEDFKILVLRETIEKYLKQNNNYLAQLEDRCNQMLIDLAFNHYLQSRNVDLQELRKSYKERLLADAQFSNAQFQGLIVYSNKKKQLKLLAETIAQLPQESWIGVIESINKTKRKPIFRFFYGEVLVSENDLTKEYYVDSSKLSAKKRNKIYKKYLVKGVIKNLELNSEQIDNIVEKEVKKLLEQEWLKSLKGRK